MRGAVSASPVPAWRPGHHLVFCSVCLDCRLRSYTAVSFPCSSKFQSFSQYRCKTAKKSEEEIDFLRSNPKIWNVHSVLNVLHSLVDKSNINRQLEVYTSGGECCLPSVPGEQRLQVAWRSHHLWYPALPLWCLGVNRLRVLMVAILSLAVCWPTD